MLTQLKKKLTQGLAVTFKVKIIPKSAKNQIVGTLGADTLKIKIAAVAAKGKANQALIAFLAEIFDTPRQNITIQNGLAAPRKTVKILSSKPCPTATPPNF